MGHAQSSNKLVSSESRLSLIRRKVSSTDVRSSTRSFTSDRWRHSETNVTKQKLKKFGSIRRKLVRRTRKGSDYRRHIRNLLQSWSVKEIQSFVGEYEALDALRDMTRLSDAARAESPSLKADMANLYDYKYCSDAELLYQGVTFHVHKAILCARCHFFVDYLPKFNLQNSIKLEEKDFDYSPSLFSSLLKYIYCGYTRDCILTELLSNLADKFGVLNSLDSSMKELFEDDSHADLILVFPSPSQFDEGKIGNEEVAGDNTLEVYCHSAILCARSLYLRSLLLEQMKHHKMIERTPMKLVLSEKIIPRSYIRVILHCMYTDHLDLSSVIKWKVADDGSGEADRLLTTLELAMELYEIGQFLDFPVLREACENVVVENLNIYSLLSIWDWSTQPYGSKYVHRQVVQYLSDEFCILCKSINFLANLPKQLLLSVIKSDFLQASEEYILSVVIRWGEWQIAKANEKPGVSPTNSLPRRSPKRRDINNEVLKEYISDLLIHIRVKHILPPHSSVLQSAYQRGLLERPCPFDVVGSEADNGPPSMVFWLREFRHSDYMRPRLFLPYVDEVKMVLHDRLTSENDHSSSSSSSPHCMPDMLPCNYASLDKTDALNESYHDPRSSIYQITNLDDMVMKNIVMREKELKTSAEVLRALAVTPDNMEISREVQKRVVREFDLPDDLAFQIFRQTPDLIEMDSSSASSKQSTLSKVGLLMNDEEAISSYTSSYIPGSAVSSYSSNYLSDVSSSHSSSQVYENPVYIHTTGSGNQMKIHDSQKNETSPEENNNRTNLTLDLSPEMMEVSTGDGFIRQVGVRSVDDSPLDLPNRDHILTSSAEIPLPNVLLDTSYSVSA